MTPAENIWNVVLDRYSHLQIDLIGNLIVQLLFFWIPSAIYIALPYIYPQFTARKKLQKQENQPTPTEIWDCFTLVLRNQMVTFTLRFVLLLLCVRLGVPPSYRFDAELPSLWEVKKHIFVCVVSREALFYYIHRALHHPWLYTQIHKRHHRFTAPVALAAQYASLTEHILANTLPVVIPPILLRTHIVTMWIFFAWTLFETASVHSGFAFGRLVRRHDAHHEKFNIWFGYLGFMDVIHGTAGQGSEGKKKRYG